MTRRLLAGGTAVLTSLAFTSSAFAQGNTVVVPNQSPPPAQQPTYVTPAPAVAPAAPVGAEEETREGYAGPSRALLATGLVTFGLFYGASAIVAGSSNHQGDQHLYVPIAGPWMDMADRGGCGSLNQPGCDAETTNKVLLGLDGVFQAVGVVTVIAAFMAPERRVVHERTAAKKTLTVVPTSYGHGTGAGLTAVGTF